jgi:[ribosomal protein S18]-alanine N-acetyltransferase
MIFTFSPMTEADARAIGTWQYEGPYHVYSLNRDGTDLSADDEFLDRRSPYFAVHSENNELVGFFCFGTSAEVSGEVESPQLWSQDRCLTIGLGLHPEWTGRGLGLPFVEAGLDFARSEFAPSSFRLFVLAWNKRATRVYERAGFRRISTYLQRGAHSVNEFAEMYRET